MGFASASNASITKFALSNAGTNNLMISTNFVKYRLLSHKCGMYLEQSMSDVIRSASNSANLFTLLLPLLFSTMPHTPDQERATAQIKTSLTTTAPARNILTYRNSKYGFIMHFQVFVNYPKDD